MTDDAFTLVFAGDIRNFPNPLRTETPFGIAIGAADRDLMAGIENEEAVEALSLTVSPLPGEIAELQGWLRAAVGLFPVHGDQFRNAAAALERMARENERQKDPAESGRMLALALRIQELEAELQRQTADKLAANLKVIDLEAERDAIMTRCMDVLDVHGERRKAAIRALNQPAGDGNPSTSVQEEA